MSAKEIAKNQEQSPERVETPERTPVYVPEVDISENEKEFTVIADMPGVDENSVDIDLDRNVLTLRARFTLEAPEGYNLTWQEYTSGNYERSFTLGNTVDREKIEASVKNGVLSMTLPKAAEAQPKRISVKAG